MYLDDEDSALWDLENFDLGPASGGWTIDVANDEFWDDRGNYQGSQPDSKWDRAANRPGRHGAALRRLLREVQQPRPAGGDRLHR